jgi:thiamine-monophosphate kinase
MSSELARIEELSRLFGATLAGGGGVVVGIGDDAAVLEGNLVWTIDEQVEGTHFRRDLASWRDIGWRSFMAAASDLAAMGAAPWCALSALALPADLDDAALAELAAGQADAARAIGASIVGGNLARAERVSITTTLLGRAAHPVLRSGAKPGDSLWLAGAVGHAAAGLRILNASAGAPASAGAIAQALLAWRRPVARIADGLHLAGAAHAAVDISDGLARDAGHIAQASGARLILDAAALEADDVLVVAAAAAGASPLDLALHGGEDYALLAAGPGPLEGFRRVGDVIGGAGVALRTPRGIEAIDPRGFDHFD